MSARADLRKTASCGQSQPIPALSSALACGVCYFQADWPSNARPSARAWLQYQLSGNRAPRAEGSDMVRSNHLVHPNGAIQMQTAHSWGRRDFVKGIAALAGAAGLSAYDIGSAAAEPPPETKKIRL